MNDEVLCTNEETQARIEFCKVCPSFNIKENFMTECKECGCSISLMSTFKFKICPKGNWE